MFSYHGTPRADEHGLVCFDGVTLLSWGQWGPDLTRALSPARPGELLGVVM